MATQTRPNDAIYRRFTGPVMTQIRALVPDFPSDKEALKFYKKLRSYQRFKKHQQYAIDNGVTIASALPDGIRVTNDPHRCTSQPGYDIEIMPRELNPMEILHVVTHWIQPSGTPWHGGQFSPIFLDLIERMFDADVKRQAKDVLIAHNIKTHTKSDAARVKQSQRYYRRKVEVAPNKAVEILDSIRDLLEELDE